MKIYNGFTDVQGVVIIPVDEAVICRMLAQKDWLAHCTGFYIYQSHEHPVGNFAVQVTDYHGKDTVYAITDFNVDEKDIANLFTGHGYNSASLLKMIQAVALEAKQERSHKPIITHGKRARLEDHTKQYLGVDEWLQQEITKRGIRNIKFPFAEKNKKARREEETDSPVAAMKKVTI